MPIRWKITLWYSIILSLILVVIGFFLYLLFAQKESSEFDERLVQTSSEVIRSIKVENNLFYFPFQTKFVLPNMDIFTTANTFLQAIDLNGNVIDRSASLGKNNLPISKQIISRVKQGESSFATITIHNTKIRIYTMPIMDNDKVYGILQVGGTLDQIEHSLANLRWILVIVFLITILIVGGAAWFLAKRVLRPIDQLIQTTSEIEKGQDLKKRINYTGPADEIGQLIDQSNHMFARLDQVYEDLEQSYQMQKRFVSDASHELRTPLTSIKGNIDFLKKIYKEKPELIEEIINDVANEADRMTRLLNHLLSLARADAGYQIHNEPIAMRDFVDDFLPNVDKLKPEIGFEVKHLERLDGLVLDGNRDYLLQLLYILLENAFKYTKTGTVSVDFNLQQQALGKQLMMIISDTGIGIRESDTPHVFSRFYRGENTDIIAGTGLGLPIAKWIVEQHNGSIELKSVAGEGTQVIVCLPVRKENCM